MCGVPPATALGNSPDLDQCHSAFGSAACFAVLFLRAELPAKDHHMTPRSTPFGAVSAADGDDVMNAHGGRLYTG